MNNHAAAKGAANILLDMVTAFNDDLGLDPANDAAMSLAFRRFDEVDAVTSTWDDERPDPPVLDVSPLVGGTVVSMKWLVGRVAAHARTSEEEVVADLRAFLDESWEA